MSDYTFAQAALTPKLGGLGLRKSVEHADLAYSASWHESQRTAKETWLRPAQVSVAHVPVSSVLPVSASSERTRRQRRRLPKAHQASGSRSGAASLDSPRTLHPV